jgi:hypothetical protein
MILQAAGAARLLRADPDRGEVALVHVDDLCQQAIVELQRMLGLLGVGGACGDADATPPPGLKDIGVLVKRVRADGLDVWVTVAGDPVFVDAGVDLSAYRIVREALTNASRYADPRQPVRVAVHWRRDDVEIVVLNGTTRARCVCPVPVKLADSQREVRASRRILARCGGHGRCVSSDRCCLTDSVWILSGCSLRRGWRADTCT